MIIEIIKDIGSDVIKGEGVSQITIFFFILWFISMVLLCIRIEQCKKQKTTIESLMGIIDMYIKQRKKDGEEDKTSE